jgi:DNA-3-methyladenine glycosylase
MELRRGVVGMCIIEAEAYGNQMDTASHARHGRTARNEPMWGPPGRLYVYLCYGIHQMLNVVTGPKGEAGAVLIRACLPLRGLATIRARRGGRRGPDLLVGPGKVGAALAIDRSWNRHPVFEFGGIEIGPPSSLSTGGSPPTAREIICGPRVGIGFAQPQDRSAPLRFLLVRGGHEGIGQSSNRAAGTSAEQPSRPPAERQPFDDAAGKLEELG